MNKYIRKISHYFTHILPDKEFVKLQYFYMKKKLPNLKNPKELDEKLQWLKLYDHNELYIQMVDKYLVKQYISDNIGSEYIIPTIGFWESANDINWDSLPGQFVLKCNHDSRSIVICKNKKNFDFENAKKKLNHNLKNNGYWYGREWPYKNVKPLIIAEPYLKNSDGSSIVDYKFYCYGGKLMYFMYSVGETETNRKNHKFDINLNSIDHLFKEKEDIPYSKINLPSNINKMIDIVNVLCKDFEHIRIDLYNIDGDIKFGEFTFFSSSGYINIKSSEYKQKLSDLINIEKVKLRNE